MTCFAPKCTVRKEGERQVVCWLCDDLYHMKCVGLLARTTDQLVDSEIGLRWCCLKCRKVDIEFYRFFTSNRYEFSEMHKEFASLYAKFRKFEERFDKFDCLNELVRTRDNASSSPKRKKVVESISSPQVVNTAPPVLIYEPMDTQANVLALPTTRSRGFQNLIEFDPNSPTASGSLRGTKSPDNVDGISKTAEPVAKPPTFLNRIPQTDPKISAPKELTVVKPRKTIFVSRLSRDTTVNDLLFYVKSKLDTDHDILCFKINANSTRSISSFRLIVPCEIFDGIVDSEFWPLGILVREYVYRENPRSNPVFLPTHVRSQVNSNVSKN